MHGVSLCVISGFITREVNVNKNLCSGGEKKKKEGEEEEEEEEAKCRGAGRRAERHV